MSNVDISRRSVEHRSKRHQRLLVIVGFALGFLAFAIPSGAHKAPSHPMYHTANNLSTSSNCSYGATHFDGVWGWWSNAQSWTQGNSNCTSVAAASRSRSINHDLGNGAYHRYRSASWCIGQSCNSATYYKGYDRVYYTLHRGHAGQYYSFTS